MEIFEYAIQMERDGEAYYRELAAKTSHSGLRNICSMLADEEVKHQSILQQIWKEEQPRLVVLREVQLRARNLFTDLRDKAGAPDPDQKELDFYRKAQELEQQSIDFYRDKAESADTPAAREVFLVLADEEKLHYDMLDTIAEFVARPEPGNWLEDAEWYHFDEY